MNFNKGHIYFLHKKLNKAKMIEMKELQTARHLCSSYNWIDQVKL